MNAPRRDSRIECNLVNKHRVTTETSVETRTLLPIAQKRSNPQMEVRVNHRAQ